MKSPNVYKHTLL